MLVTLFLFNRISYVCPVETDFSNFLCSAMPLVVLVFHFSPACEVDFLCLAVPAGAVCLSQVVLLP